MDHLQTLVGKLALPGQKLKMETGDTAYALRLDCGGGFLWQEKGTLMSDITEERWNLHLTCILWMNATSNFSCCLSAGSL